MKKKKKNVASNDFFYLFFITYDILIHVMFIYLIKLLLLSAFKLVPMTKNYFEYKYRIHLFVLYFMFELRHAFSCVIHISKLLLFFDLIEIHLQQYVWDIILAVL